MASSKLGADNTGDSGPAFKVIVRLCGLAAIVAIFLPFIGKFSIIDLVNLVKEPGSAGVAGNIKALFVGTTGMATLTNCILLSAFLFFPVFGLTMAIRGKYAGGPFTYLLLFNIAAFFLVNFFGPQAGIVGNFFINTGLGYWIGCGALFAPFLAMFFLDKSI
ncbi:MAG: hypothetical protein IPN95_07815 [Bacteroidetes bacterium]|nr:hypothetical protein [Bacteroidota bacterium]MBL0018685.1 hypothetical protein [Bacteroidota bacterium]